MKTSRTAWRMVKKFLQLSNELDEFILDAVWRRKLSASRQAGEGRTFRYLKQAGYIVQLGADRFQITDLSRINFLDELVKRRQPDGRLWVVIFDIPEKLKHHRNLFRQHLRELGFRMKQQSVWVSPLPCEDLVALTIKYHGLGRYVELLVGNEVALPRTAVSGSATKGLVGKGGLTGKGQRGRVLV